MRGTTLAWLPVLMLAGGSVAATEISCDVESDYELHVTQRSVILTREHGTPEVLLMRQGRLFVDGNWVQLSAADGNMPLLEIFVIISLLVIWNWKRTSRIHHQLQPMISRAC